MIIWGGVGGEREHSGRGADKRKIKVEGSQARGKGETCGSIHDIDRVPGTELVCP